MGTATALSDAQRLGERRAAAAREWGVALPARPLDLKLGGIFVLEDSRGAISTQRTFSNRWRQEPRNRDDHI